MWVGLVNPDLFSHTGASYNLDQLVSWTDGDIFTHKTWDSQTYDTNEPVPTYCMRKLDAASVGDKTCQSTFAFLCQIDCSNPPSKFGMKLRR